MRSVGQGATLLCAMAMVAGCGASTEPTSPRLSQVEASFSSSAADQQHVTGNITMLLPDFGNALERYSLSAIRHADGRVTGELEETSEQDGGQRVHAQMYCFTIVGKTARLAARVDQTNVPFGPAGTYVVWSVVDNGEGAKSAPDQSTDLFFNATQAAADLHCGTGIARIAPFYPSIRGNLQVN